MGARKMELPTAIVAVITMKKEGLKGGGVPFFIADNKEELQKISGTLEKILDASAHEVDPNTMIVVTH